MTDSEASQFFLKPESYCTLDLPPYLTFGDLLSDVAKHLASSSLKSQWSKTACNFERVNYTLLSNKDGKYAWRPLQLCHPALYVQLVRDLTSNRNWAIVKSRFKDFAREPHLKCLSVPVESNSKLSDKAAQIVQWWEHIEQRAIELSLQYCVLAHADIADCYGSIYTHSIAWALHTKSMAKGNKKDQSLVGNLIDKRIQEMQHGQTNGIPQGSVLMDFVAEMVLGYADTLITECIASHSIENYQILRYRDDYRVFTNSSKDNEIILKCISEQIATLGLRLNTSKTIVSRNLVSDSLKADKIPWLSSSQRHRNLEKHLLLIHSHASRYPNSGSLMRALSDYHKKIMRSKK